MFEHKVLRTDATMLARHLVELGGVGAERDTALSVIHHAIAELRLHPFSRDLADSPGRAALDALIEALSEIAGLSAAPVQPLALSAEHQVVTQFGIAAMRRCARDQFSASGVRRRLDAIFGDAPL